jgi:hypothetical protein
MSVATAAGPLQSSHSHDRVPRTHDRILLSQIQDSPNLEGQVPVFISPRNRVTRLYPPGTAFLFRRLLRPAGLWWNYSNCPSLALVVLITLLHGPGRKHRFQQYLCCMHILCRGNGFTMLLHSNGCTRYNNYVIIYIM